MPLLPATKKNIDAAFYDIWTFFDLIGFQGGSENFGTIHRELAEFITSPQYDGYEAYKRRVVLMPRGHLKSTIGCVGYALWRIFRNPNIRIIVGTNVLALVHSFIRELRQWFEDPELQQRVWNNTASYVHAPLIPGMDKGRRSRGNHEDNYTEAEDKKVIWNNTAIQVLRQGKFKEPTVYALSVGSKVTGQHYDLAILDDIVDFDNTATVAKMDKTYEWAQDLESVLDPIHTCEFTGEEIGDEVIINGTRYAANDYYELILNEAEELGYKTFIKNIYTNGVDNADGYIWFEKFNDETVRKLKARLTSRRWASQYLNSILIDGTAILSQDNIQYIPASNTFVSNGVAEIRIGSDRVFVRLYMVVDPAVSQSKTADNTSIAVGGQDDQGNLYIVDGVAGKLTPQKIVEEIFRLADKWQLGGVFIEVVGWQGALEHYIREKFSQYRPLAIYPWNPQGKGKKKERIEFYLQPVFNQRMIWCPPWMKQWDILLNELLSFGSATGHDDVLDTWAMIKEISKPIKRKTQKRTFSKQFNNKWGGSY